MHIYHNHHIIPRHMGGKDTNDNLVKLSLEEHAAAHKNLWEQHKLLADYRAWKGLEGQIKALTNPDRCSKLPKAQGEHLRSGDIQRKAALERIAAGTHNNTNFYVTTACPHCGKVGQHFILKRWHFDNCKLLVKR